MRTMALPLLLLLLLLSCHVLLCSSASDAVRVPIKINAGPSPPASNTPGRSFRHGNPPPPPPPPITAGRPAAPFALPPVLLPSEGEDGMQADEAYEEALWRQLDGSCLAAQLGLYSYSFCPYHNVTQRETAGTFQAVLGVWSGWTVTSALQLAQRFTDGAACGEGVNRSVLAVLHCSVPSSSSLSSSLSVSSAAELGPPHVSRVLEPSTCQYELHFHTPLVCSLYHRVRAEARALLDCIAAQSAEGATASSTAAVCDVALRPTSPP